MPAHANAHVLPVALALAMVHAAVGGTTVTATVTADPTTLRAVGGVSTLDRIQYFGGHWGTDSRQGAGSSDWRPEDLQEFGASGYRAHPGRGFVVSSQMAQSQEDPARPGHVDRDAMIKQCRAYPHATYNWPVDEVDMVHSSKTEQLYPNGCHGQRGTRPKGFVPGSHNATAEFFALYYTHCMYNTTQPRYLMEVANECNVKVWPDACGTTWDEMVQLHVKVADAVHAAHALEPTRPRPLVCGPTAAFPEYEMTGFLDWRQNGSFYRFAAAATGHVDCLSVHFYCTFTPEPEGMPTDPYSSDFTVHIGGNLEAELDLQEAATAALSHDGQTPLPLLVSEYGGGFKSSGSPQYSAGHDWWVLRAANAKLMAFLDRPDRILKALPFIVGKATWDAAGRANNASHSYPFVLWRAVVPPGADPANQSAAVYVKTHLHKWYAAFADLGGERFVVRSDDAMVQAQGFRSSSPASTATTTSVVWTLVINNLAFQQDGNKTVGLSWPALPGGVDHSTAPVQVLDTKRLYWDAMAGAPALDVQQGGGDVPALLELRPAELVVIRVRADLLQRGVPGGPGGRSIDEQTYYSPRLLEPLAVSRAAAAARPFAFTPLPGTTSAGAGTGSAAAHSSTVAMRVRVGFGGSATSTAASEAAFARTVAGLNVVVGGVECAVDPARQVAGTPPLWPLGACWKSPTPCFGSQLVAPLGQSGGCCFGAGRNVRQAMRFSVTAHGLLLVTRKAAQSDGACHVDPTHPHLVCFACFACFACVLASGPLHVNAKDYTYFTSIQVEVPAAALPRQAGTGTDAGVVVVVWSEGADGTSVVSTVVLTVVTQSS